MSGTMISVVHLYHSDDNYQLGLFKKRARLPQTSLPFNRVNLWWVFALLQGSIALNDNWWLTSVDMQLLMAFE
jgi:hypothetical protein